MEILKGRVSCIIHVVVLTFTFVSTDLRYEHCAVLKPLQNNTVTCPRNHSLETENWKAYKTVSPCILQHVTEYTLYREKIRYFQLNESSVSIPNNYSLEALLFYNCTTNTSIPSLNVTTEKEPTSKSSQIPGTDEKCKKVSKTVSCPNHGRLHIYNIFYDHCCSRDIDIKCSNDTSCYVEVFTTQTDFLVEFLCTEENCATLEPGDENIVACQEHLRIEGESMEAYTTDRPCSERYFPIDDLYPDPINYTSMNDSAVLIPNINDLDDTAIILYNCSKSFPSLIPTTETEPSTSNTGDLYFTEQYSHDATSRSYVTFHTEDSSSFKTTDSTNGPRTLISPESKISVGGIVGGVTSSLIVLIVAVIIVLRRCRSEGSVNKKSNESNVGISHFNENVLTKHETKTSQNEYFELDAVECTTDYEGKTQNYNYFILEKEIPESDVTYESKFVINSKNAINGKCQQTLTEASDRNDVYGSNNDGHGTLGKRINNTPSRNKPNLYDHLGTADQDHSMYTGTYDHIDRCKGREDDDGVYDVGERNLTDDEYDVSGSFNRSLPQNDGVYDVGIRKQTDDEYDVSVNFNRSLTQNDGMYDVGERKQTDDDYDVSGNFDGLRENNNVYSTMQ